MYYDLILCSPGGAATTITTITITLVLLVQVVAVQVAVMQEVTVVVMVTLVCPLGDCTDSCGHDITSRGNAGSMGGNRPCGSNATCLVRTCK